MVVKSVLKNVASKYKVFLFLILKILYKLRPNKYSY